MNDLNYQTICQNGLLKELPEKQRDVISRRFGLKGERETLESIGRSYDITRERVRQIEEDGLKKLRGSLATPACQNIFQTFVQELKKSGNLRREDVLLAGLGGNNFQNHVYFLLTLGQPFERFSENNDFYAFWTLDKSAPSTAKKVVSSFTSELKKKKQPMALPASVSSSYVEISKNILKGPEGLYGLRDWPEINPKGVKDKAYLVFKKNQKPLHFSQVATLINSSQFLGQLKPAVVQTVHNELIKDQRFVLVGRGLYALKEWGYQPGVVKDVISQVLKQSKKPLEKGQIVEKVLEQRQVKPTTILLNLQNKKYFKNIEGKYTTLV
jgi:hypothetical protein